MRFLVRMFRFVVVPRDYEEDAIGECFEFISSSELVRARMRDGVE
jgi:hypothetical protein